MKTTFLISALAIGLAALIAAQSASAAPTFCVSVLSKRQGNLVTAPEPGKCLPGNFEGLSFSLGVARNGLAGSPTAMRQYTAFKVKKAWSASSTKLFSAFTSSDELLQVVIVFFAQDPATGQEAVGHTITLKNALLTAIDYSSDVQDGTRSPATETLSIVFSTIELVDTVTQSMAVDSVRP